MAKKSYYVPELGSREEFAEIVEILCDSGQTFMSGEELMILTTDKAAFSLEATEKGVVRCIAVRIGEKLSAGCLLLSYEPI